MNLREHKKGVEQLVTIVANYVGMPRKEHPCAF